MLVGETVAVAFQSIRANKLRSVLTMLGIIIGVGAVITMVALGSGAQKAVEDRIAALGANVFTVFAGQGSMGGIRITDRTILSTDDYEALLRDAKLLKAVVPEMQQSLQVKYGNQNSNINVVGTTPNYLEVRNYTVPHGRMFTPGDDEARQRYAVLGAAVPRMLGANPAAMINQTLQIRGINFEIIGVLSEKGSAGGWSEPRRADPHPAPDRAVPRVRHRPAALDVGAGGRRRADRAGDGGHGADSPAGAPDPSRAATTTSPSGTSRTSWPPSSRPPRCSPPSSRASRR